MPAIGASTTGVSTRSDPRVSEVGRPVMSSLSRRRQHFPKSGAGGYSLFFLLSAGFLMGPVQVIGSKSWLGRKLTAVSSPPPGTR